MEIWKPINQKLVELLWLYLPSPHQLAQVPSYTHSHLRTTGPEWLPHKVYAQPHSGRPGLIFQLSPLICIIKFRVTLTTPDNSPLMLFPPANNWSELIYGAWGMFIPINIRIVWMQYRWLQELSFLLFQDVDSTRLEMLKTGGLVALRQSLSQELSASSINMTDTLSQPDK